MSSVNLAWAADGPIDSYNIYRSLSPMNVASLPAPLVTGVSTKSYSDSSIALGNLYYYRVGSVRNGVEKVSAEIEALSFAEYANTYLRLKSDVTDRGTNPKTFTNNGVIFQNGLGVFAGSQYIAASAKSPDFNFGTGDFTIEFAMLLVSGGGGNAIDLRNLYGNTGTQVTSDYANLVIVDTASVSWSNGAVWRTANFSFTIGQLYSIAITRASGLLRIFIDGVKKLEIAETTNCSGDRYMHIGVARLKDGTYQSYFKGSIKNVRITKGVAKYTANYSIAYQK